MAAGPNVFVPVLVVCYIAWRMYRRIQRHIGRQPLRRGRLIYLIVIYSVILLLVGVSAVLRGTALLTGLGAGLVLGPLLALIGLRLTVFETTPEGQFYRPNTYIGVGLSVLLVARVVYRIFVIFNAASQQGPPSLTSVQTPLTLLLFGLLFAYYIAYYSGVLLGAGTEKSAPQKSPPA